MGMGRDTCGWGSRCSQKWGEGGSLQGGLVALGSVHGLLHVSSHVPDLARDRIVTLPLGGIHGQVTAGHVLVVALPLGLAGLHTGGDGVAVTHPFHLHTAWVEVLHQAHQGGFAL